jgi:hypothetical protein
VRLLSKVDVFTVQAGMESASRMHIDVQTCMHAQYACVARSAKPDGGDGARPVFPWHGEMASGRVNVSLKTHQADLGPGPP